LQRIALNGDVEREKHARAKISAWLLFALVHALF
jgi:hypothetical protein